MPPLVQAAPPTAAPARDNLLWDAASSDYLEHRPGYPEAFFRLLGELGVGLQGQDILDLGAGTGALSIPLALRGANLTGVDVSAGQIGAAVEAAKRNGVSARFFVAPAEETGLPSGAFDVVTASMAWGYFDLARMLVEIPRLLRPSGRLLLSSLVWVRHKDPVASHSEKLILRYNAGAASSFNRSEADPVPEWAKERFRLKAFVSLSASLSFTRESWAGRIRASRFILAALPREQAEAFDREHLQLLAEVAPERFQIPHDIRIQILEPIRNG